MSGLTTPYWTKTWRGLVWPIRHSNAWRALVSLSIDWAGHALRAHLLAGRGLAHSVAPGDRLLLSVRAEDVHVLDG